MIPPGYRLKWSGQFEYLERAKAKLSRRPPWKPSRPSAIARSCRHCSTTRCTERSSASSRFQISDTRAAACRISKSTARARRRGFLPLHPGTNAVINDYLDASGHGEDDNGALFRPIKNNRGKTLEHALTPDAVYKLVKAYSLELGFEIGAHALRATAATNALDHQADIAKVQEWLGHANISRIYDHRKTRPEDSPTFKVNY
jgi:integrase